MNKKKEAGIKERGLFFIIKGSEASRRINTSLGARIYKDSLSRVITTLIRNRNNLSNVQSFGYD